MDPRKVCQICSAEAPKGCSFFSHYGATCCLNCKAFFRRLARGDTIMRQCKNSGSCDLNLGRRTCKRCRQV